MDIISEFDAAVLGSIGLGAWLSESSFYHNMLMERLGLTNWGLIEGESSTPA